MVPSQHSASIHSTEIDNVDTRLVLFLTCSCSNEVFLAIAMMVKYSVVFTPWSRASSADRRFAAGLPIHTLVCFWFFLFVCYFFSSKNSLWNIPLRSFPNPVPLPRWVASFSLVVMAAKWPRPPSLWCPSDVLRSSPAVFVGVGNQTEFFRRTGGSFVMAKRKTDAE